MPPPTSGPYAYSPPYGTFMADQPNFLAVGQSYVDPVFGSTIRRLSNVYPGHGSGLIYAKNGFWNADGTRYLHALPGGGRIIIDTTTGSTIRKSVPASSRSSFDPVDPDILYWFSGSSLMAYRISTDASTTVKTFSGTLGALGGRLDWIDNSGRYMVLNIGGDLRVWDKQLDLLYAGAIPATLGAGLAAMAPDASGILFAPLRSGRWHVIDHATKSVDTVGFTFRSVGGDHGDLVSASNGKTYWVGNNGNNAFSAWEVLTGVSKVLVTLSAPFGWCDDSHFSGISRGAMRDWVLFDTEITSAGANCFNTDSVTNPDPVASWWPYRQEISMVNAITGDIQRLAHHRSREASLYCRQPKVNANWDGTKVMFASNYGVTNVGGSCGYSDLYSVDILHPLR